VVNADNSRSSTDVMEYVLPAPSIARARTSGRVA
jgi:hypothetical protein